MNTSSKHPISAHLHLKLYLILALISLIFLFYSIWQIKPVIVEPTDLLGLASQLISCYWIGLALILLCSILAFLDRELKKDALFIFILVVLGFFLFGIAIFSQEYPSGVGAYYPSGYVKEVIKSHHIDIGGSYHLETYSDWPAIHFITASIVEVVDIDLLPFIRYFPLLWVFCFICITYSIGKRLNLPPNLSFLLSFYILSSYWLPWSIYNSQSIGMLFYLLCFMFVLTPRNIPVQSILAILIFGALVITHSFAPLTVLLALIVVSLYRREMKLVSIFSVLFLLWYMYQAFGTFRHGVSQWWSVPFSNILAMTQQVKGVTASAHLPRVILRNVQLSYIALYAGGFIAAMALLLRRKINREDGKHIISSICWLVGVVGLGLITSAPSAAVSDMLNRYYLYGLIVAVCIILLGLRNKKVLVSLMILFTLLHMPAHYGGEAAWGQVQPTELRGAEFFAVHVKPEEPCFYNGSDIPKLVFFYEPRLVAIRICTPEWSFPSPNEPDFSVIDNASYVIFGKQGRDRQIWSYGDDPMNNWSQIKSGKGSSLIYSNGGFYVYANSGIK